MVIVRLDGTIEGRHLHSCRRCSAIEEDCPISPCYGEANGGVLCANCAQDAQDMADFIAKRAVCADTA
jgi:hypothetical protein